MDQLNLTIREEAALAELCMLAGPVARAVQGDDTAKFDRAMHNLDLRLLETVVRFEEVGWNELCDKLSRR